MAKTELVGVAYGRASNYANLLNSEGARKDDSTVEAQQDRARLHLNHLSKVKDRSYKLLEFISDEGFSGKNTRRPGFQKVIQLVRSGTIQFVVATEISRLSRS